MQIFICADRRIRQAVTELVKFVDANRTSLERKYQDNVTFIRVTDENRDYIKSIGVSIMPALYFSNQIISGTENIIRFFTSPLYPKQSAEESVQSQMMEIMKNKNDDSDGEMESMDTSRVQTETASAMARRGFKETFIPSTTGGDSMSSHPAPVATKKSKKPNFYDSVTPMSKPPNSSLRSLAASAEEDDKLLFAKLSEDQ
jgi:hypothetical protein